MDISKIEIAMTGVAKQDVERYRVYIQKIIIDMIKFERGFPLQNGKIICNFDGQKKLRETEFQFKSKE
jgi:hypothetical protein